MGHTVVEGHRCLCAADGAQAHTTIWATSQPDKTYPYDATGNRVAAGRPAETGNRVVEDANCEYQYNDEGNLTQKTDKAAGDYPIYPWDYRNQLTQVETIPFFTALTGP